MIQGLPTLFTAFFIALLGTASVAAELKEGDKVPAFTTTDDEGNAWSSKDYIGKGLCVFYFYPAAMTPGCTKQACNYRDAKDTLSAKGIRVYGVSGDHAEGLSIFKKAHNLNFPLLSDKDGTIASLFGVPFGKGSSITRKVDGKSTVLTRGVTSSRWTFVVDESGKVIYRNTRVNPGKDLTDVLGLKDLEK